MPDVLKPAEPESDETLKQLAQTCATEAVAALDKMRIAEGATPKTL